MNVNKNHIILSIIIVSGFITGYVLVRKRKPKLVFDQIDWLNKSGLLTFGKTKHFFSLSKGGTITPGKTFSDKYTLAIRPINDTKMEFVMYKDGNEVSKDVLDFETNSRL